MAAPFCREGTFTANAGVRRRRVCHIEAASAASAARALARRAKRPMMARRLSEMVRADSKQDSDRPHFYSQFWIDVALGKPTAATITTPAEDEVEEEDDELSFAAPHAEVKPETRAKASKATEKKPDTGRSTLTSLADLANIDMLMKNSAAMDDTMMPDISAGMSAVEAPSAGVVDFTEAEAPADTEDFAYDEDDDDEEGDDWGGSRRKKPGKNKRREPHREF